MSQESTQAVILVTGGTGMTGYAVRKVVETEALPNEKWIFVGSKDADLRSRSETDALFEKYKPTHVLHLAAKVGGMFRNINFSCDMMLDNLNINGNVYDVCKETGVKKLVSCMATCIYPDNVTYPIDETMLHNGPPHDTAFAFSYAKRMLDVMNRTYNRQYGCKFTSAIPNNIYGPNELFSIVDGHVIGGLVHKIYRAKNDRTPVTVWGTGKPLRQYIYSIDLAKILMWMVREYDEIEPLVVSVDESEEVSIKETAETIMDALDFDGQVVYDTSKADGQFRKTASNAKLRKYLPDFKFTPFRQGIDETVKWFVNNYDTCRK